MIRRSAKEPSLPGPISSPPGRARGASRCYYYYYYYCCCCYYYYYYCC